MTDDKRMGDVNVEDE